MLARRVGAVNVGDMMFGIVLFTVAGTPTVERTVVYVLGSLAGAVVSPGSS